MLKFFDIANLELQKLTATLSDCRVVIDALLEEVEDEKDSYHSDLHGCFFEENRVPVDDPYSPDSVFESIVYIEIRETPKQVAQTGSV